MQDWKYEWSICLYSFNIPRSSYPEALKDLQNDFQYLYKGSDF